jgi:D-glycero-alpha-D-manno-heptose-7-phosphate kinase
MHIVKAPLRISLFGGGTDLPEYYEKHGSTIISMAIDKHMYLVHNPRPTGGYRLAYSQIEELSSLTTAQHTIVRQAALDYGEPAPCTLSIISDVPKGTGLGSSSALAVCVHRLFRTDRGERQAETAHAAYRIEHQVSSCGVQDHLPAAFGGFNVYTIGRDGKATARQLPQRLIDIINGHGLLLYTGRSRPADAILKTVKKSTEQLHRLHDLALYVEKQLDKPRLDACHLAGYLKLTWSLKRTIGGVKNAELDTQHDIAIDAGAMGGKLLGAGGGGCWFFLVKPESRRDVTEATGLVEIPFRITQAGVKEMRF